METYTIEDAVGLLTESLGTEYVLLGFQQRATSINEFTVVLYFNNWSVTFFLICQDTQPKIILADEVKPYLNPDVWNDLLLAVGYANANLVGKFEPTDKSLIHKSHDQSTPSIKITTG